MENKTSEEQASIPAERLAHGFRRGQANVSRNFVRASKEDTYGYMFTPKSLRSKLPYTPDNKSGLEELGRLMLDPSDTDDPAQLSTIDSGYTYFGQFVDHDLTLDRDSDLDNEQDAQAIINYRTPNFDLDSLYGDGPAIDTFLYDHEQLRFIIGLNEFSSVEFDLPRNRRGNDSNSTATAIIGDPRNDENLFVAQLHLGMLKFHNNVVNQLKNDPAVNSKPNHELFQIAQEEVRHHYQWVIVHDYLKTIIGSELVSDLISNGPKFFTVSKTGKTKFFVPVEFSVAAYRFGHSMIRDRYRFNSMQSNSAFSEAFSFTRRQVNTSWIIDWAAFFSIGNQAAANKARKINTQVALSMGQLPIVPGTNPPDLFKILSSRNLIRGMALGLPSGQAVAKKIKAPVLSRDQLLSHPNQGNHDQVINLLLANNELLLKQTPLWYYILKEAEVLHDGNMLGPVGGRIVGEVFIRILKDDPKSILNNVGWTPKYGIQSNDPTAYRIIDILRFAGMPNIPNA